MKTRQIKKPNRNANFKRVKPLKDTRGDKMLIQAYMRIIRDIMTARGLSMGALFDMVARDGRINFNFSIYKHWLSGEAHPKTYLYSLFVIADVLGLSLFDIITIHYPEEKDAIKAILKNPDYM